MTSSWKIFFQVDKSCYLRETIDWIIMKVHETKFLCFVQNWREVCRHPRLINRLSYFSSTHYRCIKSSTYPQSSLDKHFLFQHYNAPVHKARFREIIYWVSCERTAQSPDLNPTEHLWDELYRRLWARTHLSSSLPDLTDAVGSECEQIPSI